MTLTELIAKLQDVKALDGELPVLYPLDGQYLGRYASVEHADVMQCTADSKGMKRAGAGDPAVPCLILYN